jgi:hypothetical protein
MMACPAHLLTDWTISRLSTLGHAAGIRIISLLLLRNAQAAGIKASQKLGVVLLRCRQTNKAGTIFNRILDESIGLFLSYNSSTPKYTAIALAALQTG